VFEDPTVEVVLKVVLSIPSNNDNNNNNNNNNNNVVEYFVLVDMPLLMS
jgi:hypothetical protein